MIVDPILTRSITPKTPAARPDEFETINWLMDFAHLNSLFPPSSDYRVNDLLRQLRPFSNDHVGPALPCFIFSNPHAGWLMKRPKILCRDGAIPLLSYCFDHPNPPPCKVLVAESILPFVPKSWAPQTQGYRYVSRTVFHENHKPKKLILAGLVHDLLSSTNALNSVLRKLVGLWGPQFYQDMDVVTHFRQVRKVGMKMMDESEWWEFSRVLERTLHGQHRVLKDDELMNLPVDPTVAYCEVNSELLVADSYFTHFFLSKGAGLVGSPTKHLMLNHLAYSPYHGIALVDNEPIGTQPWPEKEALSALKGVVAITADDHAGPWHAWIEMWLLNQKV